jgi:hypothetical protein
LTEEEGDSEEDDSEPDDKEEDDSEEDDSEPDDKEEGDSGEEDERDSGDLQYDNCYITYVVLQAYHTLVVAEEVVAEKVHLRWEEDQS